MDDQFEIRIADRGVSFSAAHFIVHASGKSERLHGHNYRVSARLGGDRNEYGYVYDFVALREKIAELVEDLDHRLMLPRRSPSIQVAESDGEVEVTTAESRYLFPRSDVVLLPVENTTSENLAAWLVDRLAEALPWGEVTRPTTLTVRVEECPGQGASCTRRIEGADRP